MCVCVFVCCFVGAFVCVCLLVCLVGWLVGVLLPCLFVRLLVCLFVCLFGWLVGWLVGYVFACHFCLFVVFGRLFVCLFVFWLFGLPGKPGLLACCFVCAIFLASCWRVCLLCVLLFVCLLVGWFIPGTCIWSHTLNRAEYGELTFRSVRSLVARLLSAGSERAFGVRTCRPQSQASDLRGTGLLFGAFWRPSKRPIRANICLLGASRSPSVFACVLFSWSRGDLLFWASSKS